MNPVRAALLALALAAFPAQGESGRVTGVIDGDTVDVRIGYVPVRVRLACIDSPERGQPFGSRAKQALSDLVFGRTVAVREAGDDYYHRLLARLALDDVDVSAEMVRRGYAWVYRKYCDDEDLLVLEAEAMAARRGLWTDPSPVPPWQFRRTTKRNRAGSAVR